MKSCLILMSTYNGETYLRQQLDSLLNQADLKIDININDDLSTDNTVSILEEYSNKYPNIKFKVNKVNKGFTYNFIDMVFDCDTTYDYYALSDQDDVWKENKLIEAIKLIEKEESEKGILYCSNLTLVDENLNFLGYQEHKNINKIRYAGLISNIATGCTLVFDNKLFQEIRKHYPKDIYLHDYWIYLIGQYVGKVIYDQNSYIMYRQHTNNQIGSNKKIFSKKRIKETFNSKNPKSKLIKTFYELYKEDIHKEDLKYVEEVANYNQSLIKRLKVVNSFKIRARKHNLLHKLQFLIGKF